MQEEFYEYCQEHIPLKYKVNKLIFYDGVSIKNKHSGNLTIKIYVDKKGDLKIKTIKEFSGILFVGWLLSFLFFALIGMGIYWLIFGASNKQKEEFTQEISDSLDNWLKSH